MLVLAEPSRVLTFAVLRWVFFSLVYAATTVNVPGSSLKTHVRYVRRARVIVFAGKTPSAMPLSFFFFTGWMSSARKA